jgi:hypothetical protein
VWFKICVGNNIHFQGCVEVLYEQKCFSFISVPKRNSGTDKMLNIIFCCLANVILFVPFKTFHVGHISFPLSSGMGSSSTFQDEMGWWKNTLKKIMPTSGILHLGIMI